MSKKHTHKPLKTEWYYKTADGKHWYQVTHQLTETDLVEVTKAEWDQHFAAERAKREKKHQIARLKSYLASTDYVACKIAEGEATKEEYAEVLAQRKATRLRINELEATL